MTAPGAAQKIQIKSGVYIKDAGGVGQTVAFRGQRQGIVTFNILQDDFAQFFFVHNSVFRLLNYVFSRQMAERYNIFLTLSRSMAAFSGYFTGVTGCHSCQAPRISW